MADEMKPQLGSVPSPDPTERTKQDLLREIGGLEKLLDRDLGWLKELMTTRIDGIEDRLERDERHRLEQKADTKANVHDALTAQKEAAAKSEAAFDKQLGEIKTTFATEIAGLRRENRDLRERLGRVESTVTG
jgi:hypothetical protein